MSVRSHLRYSISREVWDNVRNNFECRDAFERFNTASIVEDVWQKVYYAVRLQKEDDDDIQDGR